MENNQSASEDTPILSILQKIKDGSMDPRSLEKEDRQRCVEAMFFEGCSETNIAQILARSEKTIRRDLAEIRKKNAVSPNLEEAKAMIGEMQHQVRAQISRLTRIAVSRDSTPAAKISAEAVAWEIRDKFTSRLQTLGYLPQKPQEFVMNHQHEESSFEEIEQVLNQVKTVAEENGTLDPQLKGTLESYRSDLQKAKLSHDVKKLLDTQQNSPTKGE